MVFEDRVRAGSFGDDAEQYDRARPGYPSELFDDLLADGGRAVVDVGCGTGIVARSLLARGCSVVGVEPDPRMAEVARRSGVVVEIATFEDWDDPGRVFDVLTAGQSWHWVHPSRGAAKAAAVLRTGGRFGVFWNALHHAADVVAGFDDIYSRLAPELLENSVVLGTTEVSRELDARDAFRETGAFEQLEERSYAWQCSYTTEAWLDQLPTHSGHRVLPPDVL